MDPYMKPSYDAWVNRDETVGSEAIVVTMRLDDIHYKHYKDKADDIIKEQLCNNIVKEMMEKNYIKWNKQKDPGFEQYTEYQAKINVANMKWTNVIVNRRVFQAHGREWTEDQISKALLNTFPEYLI